MSNTKTHKTSSKVDRTITHGITNKIGVPEKKKRLKRNVMSVCARAVV